MSEPTIEARVKAVITEVLKIDQSRLVNTAKFKEDLGADSLDLASMLMALEEEFKGSISDEDAKTMTTVGGAMETITRLSASPSFTSR